MKPALSTLLTSLIFLCTLPSYADYTVQIGAYQTSAANAIDQAKPYGEVFQTRQSDQLTRISIGRFTERSQANLLRDQLKVSGYTDAFVTSLDRHDSSYVTTGKQLSNKTETNANRMNHTTQTNHIASNINSIEQLNHDERLKAVYLDGRLMIFSDGEFYTVKQYRNRN